MNNLKQYLESNLLDFNILSDNIFEIIGFGKFALVCHDRELFTNEFELDLLDYEFNLVQNTDYCCFKLGENYFYSKDCRDLKLIPLKYLGKYKSEFDLSVPFLGIHGGYELLNGSREYKDWIKKAKFLDISTLGICEKNTLAGVLKFQSICQNNNVKSIIGEQIIVRDNDNFLQFKCFVKNEMGWNNLLLINKEINVINNGKFIEKDVFLNFIEGLIIIIDIKYSQYEKSLSYSQKITEFYYQLDTVEFSNEEKDKDYLINLKKFIKSDLKPILISDAYYIDKEDSRVKQILNGISNNRDYKSENQYFKSIEENYNLLLNLFENENNCIDLFQLSLSNLFEISNKCDFKIQTNTKFLPEYIMTNEEKNRYNSKEEMFLDLIDKGLKRINKESEIEKYKVRLEEEIETIKLVQSDFGNGIDYFLISWDILRFCHENNIIVGLGRGSSAGSLVAYCLDIVKINPFDYNLLFSRFLNKGRIANGAIPDFDIDIQGEKRNDVKKYIEQKYGINNVCSVGTYTTFQLKAALKDIARQNNIEFGTANFISQLLEDSEEWQDLFKMALKKLALKNFILTHPNAIEDIQLILKQPKSNSIHACAMIIVPQNKEIYNYLPVRLLEKDGEQILISEWEGNELESAGFLKMDILGITELDKYKFIVDLIEETTDDKVDIYNLPLNIKGVFELFKKGFNGSIFQFGTQGLSSYCKSMQPENICELIDAVALYRPGAIDVNTHNEYILRKFGERQINYHWNTEEILKDTYGLIVYQEQVMQIVSQLADFDLIEADDIRRSMGKKKKEVIDKYREQFLSKIISKGCNKDEANEIWHELEVHSGYSFNLSHAAVYGITGYNGQWLKYNYPLQYWTAAFQFDDPNPKNSNIGRFISEIRRTDNFIKIMPPHINESGETFTSNPEKMELYWSITKVKQLGDKALEAIMNERNKNGSFFSLEDFLSRVEKRVVNKAVVINLILSGSFDEIEDIKLTSDRKMLINKYYKYVGTKRTKDDVYLLNHEEYWWQIKQKEISGFGIIDYYKVLRDKTDLNYRSFQELSTIYDKETETEFLVIGLIKKFTIRKTKHDDEYCRMTIDSNDEEVDVVIWNDTFRSIDQKLLEVGKMIAFNGIVVEYKKMKNIHSFEKTKIYFI